MTVVLLFIRLRALLFALCRDHPVAFCETCRQGYRPEELGTDVGKGCDLCRQCGADLRASLTTHARTVPEPHAAEAPGTDVESRLTIPPTVSQHFGLRPSEIPRSGRPGNPRQRVRPVDDRGPSQR